MKHNPTATANAAAITMGVVYIVCRQAFILAPEFAMSVGRSWFHGIDISKIATKTVPTDTFVLGLVTAVVGSWLVGYLFAVTYNWFAKK